MLKCVVDFYCVRYVKMKYYGTLSRLKRKHKTNFISTQYKLSINKLACITGYSHPQEYHEKDSVGVVHFQLSIYINLTFHYVH